jgi:pyruvate formate lyase activating enzyme
VYGNLVSRAVDPIEKKPLYHFLPGSSAYSIATVGCNLRCKNCQNWEISQSPKPQGPIMGQHFTPEQVVNAATRTGCESIAYTYTEPVVFLEFAYDTAKVAGDKGMRNVFVTNGYITGAALREMQPYLHAANIDLKGFSDQFYRETCGARLQPVLDAIALHKKLGIWVEITTLVIPTLNDSEEELGKIAKFISDVDREIPWHISRFYPSYLLIDLPPTPVETLRMAREIGSAAGLKHIYIGNVHGESEHTYCYHCGELLIQRHGYRVVKNQMTTNRCPACKTRLAGVWH